MGRFLCVAAVLFAAASLAAAQTRPVNPFDSLPPAQRQWWLERPVEEWEQELKKLDAPGRVRMLMTLVGTPPDPKAKPFAPLLHITMSDPDDRVRTVAAWAYLHNRSNFESPSPELAVKALGGVLETGTEASFEQALDVLVRHTRPEQLLPISASIAAASLRFSSDEIDEDISELLSELAPRIDQAVDKLRDALNAGDPRQQARAARALATLGPVANAAVPRLLELMHHDKADVAIAAHVAVRRIDPHRLPRPSPVRRFVPDLIKRIEAEDHNQAFLAATEVSPIGPDAAEAVRPILDLMRRITSDPKYPGENGVVLAGIFGPYGPEIVPELIRIAETDPSDPIASLAMGFIGNGRSYYEPSIDDIGSAAYRMNEARAARMLVALGSVGRKEPRTMAWLTPMLSNANPALRTAALEAIRSQRKPAPETIELVRSRMQDEDAKVRAAARSAVERLELVIKVHGPGGERD